MRFQRLLGFVSIAALAASVTTASSAATVRVRPAARVGVSSLLGPADGAGWVAITPSDLALAHAVAPPLASGTTRRFIGATAATVVVFDFASATADRAIGVIRTTSRTGPRAGRPLDVWDVDVSRTADANAFDFVVHDRMTGRTHRSTLAAPRADITPCGLVTVVIGAALCALIGGGIPGAIVCGVAMYIVGDKVCHPNFAEPEPIIGGIDCTGHTCHAHGADTAYRSEWVQFVYSKPTGEYIASDIDSNSWTMCPCPPYTFTADSYVAPCEVAVVDVWPGASRTYTYTKTPSC